MPEDRFREDADSCDRMAAIMLAPAQRDAYREMARMWRKLANDSANHRLRVAAWSRKMAQVAAEPLTADVG